MKIFLTNTFKRTAKKLHQNQKVLLSKEIEIIKHDPEIGELKIGDLAGVRVHKFYMIKQLILIAYFYNEKDKIITLLSFATHANFYDNLKKQLK